MSGVGIGGIHPNSTVIKTQVIVKYVGFFDTVATVENLFDVFAIPDAFSVPELTIVELAVAGDQFVIAEQQVTDTLALSDSYNTLYPSLIELTVFSDAEATVETLQDALLLSDSFAPTPLNVVELTVADQFSVPYSFQDPATLSDSASFVANITESPAITDPDQPANALIDFVEMAVSGSASTLQPVEQMIVDTMTVSGYEFADTAIGGDQVAGLNAINEPAAVTDQATFPPG